MAQEESSAAALDRRRQRQVAKEALVVIRKRLHRLLSCRFRHGAKRRRASRVDVVYDCVIVVAAHDLRGVPSQVLDDLGRFRSVGHEIAEDPQFVIRLVEGVERLRIAVHVRDDQNLQRLASRRDARRLVLR